MVSDSTVSDLTVSDSNGSTPLDQRNSERRPQAPTGRLKTLTFADQTDQSSPLTRVQHNQSPAADSSLADSPLPVESKSVKREALEKTSLENDLEPVEIHTDEATLASDLGQAEESNEPSRSHRSRRRRSSSGRSSSGRSSSGRSSSGRSSSGRSSSGRSSSGRSSSKQSWNDIGVDGLPIRRSNMAESESDAVEFEIEGTRLRDVTVLVLALGLSLVLTQASLWWGAGVDPLGLWPYVSGWLPNFAPTSFAE